MTSAEKIQQDNKRVTALMVELEKDIVQWLKERGIKGLLTENSNGELNIECIYGYCFDYQYGNGEVVERQVKGIRLTDKDTINVILDTDDVWYTNETLISEVYEKSDTLAHEYPIFGGECMGYFTLINIAELINEYDEKERYIKEWDINVKES